MASGESSDQEKTEQPTAKRREDARRKGQVVKSVDLTAAALLLGALQAFSVMGGRLVIDSVEVFRRGLVAAANPELTLAGAVLLFSTTSVTIVRLGWPFVIFPALAAIAAQLLQTRFAISREALVPQWSRVNPMAGLGRLVGTTNLFESLKAFVKMAVLALVAYSTLKDAWPAFFNLGHGEAALSDIAKVIYPLWFKVGMAFFTIALIDFGHKWWEDQQALKMTKEQVREESRELEGNPQLRGRIRALHRQRATRRMMVEVERADVVVRNPTHVAVALRYDGDEMRAPTVVAKGARLMARRIIEIAHRHGVPVIENPPLARSLFRAVAVGREIPRELYRMVAEVLARVYAARTQGPR